MGQLTLSELKSLPIGAVIKATNHRYPDYRTLFIKTGVGEYIRVDGIRKTNGKFERMDSSNYYGTITDENILDEFRPTLIDNEEDKYLGYQLLIRRFKSALRPLPSYIPVKYR